MYPVVTVRHCQMPSILFDLHSVVAQLTKSAGKAVTQLIVDHSVKVVATTRLHWYQLNDNRSLCGCMVKYKWSHTQGIIIVIFTIKYH